MDFVTHSLVGVGIGRLAAPTRGHLPAYCLAGMLGGLLPDSDSWLALLGPNIYGLYHRVITHSIVGLLACGVGAGLVALLAARAKRTRRFGWFVTENLSDADVAGLKLSFPRLIAVGVCGAALHWMMDWITGFGNMKPFWPWSDRAYRLGAVYSFDWMICSMTLAWHIGVRRWAPSCRNEILIALAYAVCVSAYVFMRWHQGSDTVW
ncbi:metal-dependent hydrolase [Candidatus Sumerlaeota bacterium]|nr:metal-dependent hydrolase [Candidatus Sumerlaeota bacterium]